MAGLAAALNAPTSIDAIAWALAARGIDGAVCRLTGPGDVGIDLAIRSVMPSITRVVPSDDDAPNSPRPPVAALVIDGIASVTALDGAYAERGPAGLVDEGDQPYAVVLGDAERGELVLARNGAGPSLYYARLDNGWVVASEPGALVHAGVEPEPDVAVIRHFIQTGGCDESERTFFARIRRVLPGEAIVLSTAVAGPVRHPLRLRPASPMPAEEAVWRSGAGVRVGTLMTPGAGGAAVFGAALHQPDRERPLHVFTVAIDGVDDAAGSVPTVLTALPADEVRHAALTAPLDLSTLDRFLMDLGEPVPDLGVYRLWTVARELSGDVEVLVDGTVGPLAGWERVAERMLAHYGVTVRAPLRGLAPDESMLSAIVRRAMPPHVASAALAAGTRTASSTDVVLRLRDEIAAALVPPRPWSDAAATVTALRRLVAGERADADALLRAFLVERWLAALGAAVPGAQEIHPIEQLPEITPREPDEVVIDGDVWTRVPVRTAPIASGDQLLANTAFYVANALAARGERAEGPWFAVVSGKVVAVSQQRVNPIPAIRPRRTARILAWLGRHRWPHLANPSAMQVAIDHNGLSKVAAAVLFGRTMPSAAHVYPPRAGAIAPADAAVIEVPFEPDEVAASLVAAMRLALARDHGDLLAGVAVASVDDSGCRVLGFAAGPAIDEVPRARSLLSSVLADNPAGQGAQRTPIVVVTQRAPVTVERAQHTIDRHADLAARAH